MTSMRASLIIALIALLAASLSPATAQVFTVDCEEIEIDFSFPNSNGVPITFDGQRQNFVAGSTTPITLPFTITRPVTVEVVIASDQAALVSPDLVSLTVVGNATYTQTYALFGNYFPITLNYDPNTAATTTLIVYVNQSANGTSCNATYNFLVTNPVPQTGGLVIGDPQFVGLRGQRYQIHGIDGAVYNLFSDSDYQLNSRFTFLTGPRPCPIIPSTRIAAKSCWTHPGSYISELGLKTATGEEVFIAAGPAAVGFSSVTVNGKTLAVGASSRAVALNSTHELTLSFGAFTVEVENSDLFVNLRSVRVAIDSWPTLSSHGLLGQTWSTVQHAGKIAAIEGDVDDYLIDEDSLFGDSFLFNKFHK